jgi:hypothetical protein
MTAASTRPLAHIPGSLAQAAGLAAFAWCLLGGITLSTVAVAAVFGGFAALALGVVRVTSGVRFPITVGCLPTLARRLPRRIFEDLGTLATAIADAAAGRVRHTGSVHPVPFDLGDGAADDAGRRALVVVTATLPPNSIVLTIPPVERALIVHQLIRQPTPPHPEWPL